MKKGILIGLAIALAAACVFLFVLGNKLALVIGAILICVMAFLTLRAKSSYTDREETRRKLAETKLQESQRNAEQAQQEISARKRMEEDLRESRERLDLALRSARMAAFDWDIVHDKRHWSEGVHKLMGTQPETFTGSAEEFFRVMPAEDQSRVQAALARAIETNGLYETEYRAIWPDGSVHHVAARGNVSYDQENRAVQMTGLCWDITERKQAEDQIAGLNRELEQKLRELEASRQKALNLAQEAVRARNEAESARTRLQRINESLRTASVGSLNIMEDAIRARRQAEAAILEQRRLNRTLKALGESSQAMTRATSEFEYLEEVCKSVIANCGHVMAWIGFAEQDDAHSVRPVAFAGFEEGYTKNLKLTWADEERGRGPTGTAIRTGKVCVCKDMLTDPALAPWRAEALKRGYASSVAIPLLYEGKPFGAITIYSPQANPFTKDEIDLLSQLADDVSNCIRRLRAEGQLRLLSTAVESAVNAVVITDRQGRILWVNPAFTRLTGYSREEVAGQNPRVLKSGQHPPEFYKEMWATILKGNPWRGDLINRRKDGSIYFEEMTITPVRTEGADITHFVAIKQDVTERKRDQAALQQSSEEAQRSNRDLEQFAYIASHDLQEPLRAVGGYVSLIQRRFHENIDPKAIDYIKGAAEGAARMERLITDLLAFSRVGSHGGDFAKADLNVILKEALTNLQSAIQNVQAKVTSDPLPSLVVDATQMMQLFQNLIGNAMKFRGENPPEIHVGVQKLPDRWVFSVRDNGIGIESQYFERIFQIFQRLHTRTHYAGTGIGLAICKKMVERHHGAIWVESEPGKGSTFFFSLPATSDITQGVL